MINNLQIHGGKRVTERNTQPVPMAHVFKQIQKSVAIKETVKKLRAMPGDDEHRKERQKFKADRLPYFTSAVFDPPTRKTENVKENLFMIFDVDHLNDPAELKQFRRDIEADPRTAFCFTSPSGAGVKFGFVFKEPVTDANEYKRLYEKAVADIEKTYLVKCDHTKDSVRTCFLSHDPTLFVNAQAEQVTEADFPEIQPTAEPPNPAAVAAGEPDGTKQDTPDRPKIPADFDQMIEFYATQMGRNREQWIVDALSLCDLGEAGREYFIKMSVLNPAYDDTPDWLSEKYDELLSNYEGKIKLASFIRQVKQAGYRPHTVEMTENALAELFVERFRDKARFCRTFSAWFHNNGVVWAQDEVDKAPDLARQVIEEYREYGRDIRDENEVKKFKRFIDSFETISRQRSLLENAATRQGVRVAEDELDQKPHLFACKDTVVDLERLDFSTDPPTIPTVENPADQLLTLASDVPLVAGAKCERWQQFLRDWFIPQGDATADDLSQGAELIKFIQRGIGYTLSGYGSESKIFFCYGDGANGKSVFMEALRMLFGSYYKKSDIRSFMVQKTDRVRDDLAALRGARLIIGSEVEDGMVFSESLIKDLSGNDPITARHLYGRPFTFKPQGTIWLYGNSQPRIRGGDYSIQRRILMVPFDNRIDDEKRLPAHEIEQILKEELPGILLWALRGYADWKKFGLRPPAIVTQHTQDYFEANDVVQQFVAENCNVVDSENQMLVDGTVTEAKKLWESFRTWLDESGERVKVTKRKFLSDLERKGFQKRNGAGNRVVFAGLELLGAEDQQHTEKPSPW